MMKILKLDEYIDNPKKNSMNESFIKGDKVKKYLKS